MSVIKADISLTSNVVLPESFYDKLLSHNFGYSDKQIKQSRDILKSNDIYQLKEWLDGNIDLLAPMKAYQQALDNNDTKAIEELKKEWVNENKDENKTNDNTPAEIKDEIKDNNNHNFQFPVQ
eukprot:499965_1